MLTWSFGPVKTQTVTAQVLLEAAPSSAAAKRSPNAGRAVGAQVAYIVLGSPRRPNVPLLRALWSLLAGIWGVSKGSWGVLDSR